MMQASSELIAVLKAREALRLTAYQDQAGVWTIGWGSTFYENGARVRQGEKITQARAVQLLNYHLGIAVGIVNNGVKVDLNQGQFDALVSFCYNVGPDFLKSTLRTLINTNPNDFDRIELEFMRWVYVTVKGQKVVSNGLVNRRKEEVQMYRSGVVKKKVKPSGSRLQS